MHVLCCDLLGNWLAVEQPLPETACRNWRRLKLPNVGCTAVHLDGSIVTSEGFDNDM